VKAWQLVAVVAALAAAAAVAQTCRLQRARWDAWSADTARTNTVARASVTERTLVRLGDSVQLVNSRLVEQGRVQMSAAAAQVARANREVATANARVTVLASEVARLTQRGTASTRPDSAVDSAATPTVTLIMADSVDTAGVSVRAVAEASGLPLPAGFRPTSTLWTWQVTRRAIGLELTLTCFERQARAHVVGPAGQPVELDQLKQDERICSPAPATWRPFSLQLPSAPWAAALLAAGAALGWAAHP
jgi:hypothetical protein